MKKFVLTLIVVLFLITSVNICLAEKGRDPPDPPAAPQIDLSLQASLVEPPDPQAFGEFDGAPRFQSDRSDF